MDLEGIMLNKSDKRNKISHFPYNFTYMRKVKNKIETLIDSENKVRVSRWKGSREAG